MIVLERTRATHADPRDSAGDAAEAKMEFYLRRVFGDEPEVFVFNDLQFSYRNENSQIDHLILHRFGLAIIESKSIIGTISVDGLGEFSRTTDRGVEGMQSPIQQAELQSKLLRTLLNDATEPLLEARTLNKSPKFQESRFRVFVAISDQGIIRRDGAIAPELMKADRIPKEIKASIEKYRQTEGMSGFARYMKAGVVGDKEKDNELITHRVLPFTARDLERTSDFILSIHNPREPIAPSCPNCGARMQRVPKSDPQFWGCTTYASKNCPGRRSFDDVE